MNTVQYLYELLVGTVNELTKIDIRRILKLGFDQYKIMTDGFIQEYKETWKENDEEVHRVLYLYLEVV